MRRAQEIVAESDDERFVQQFDLRDLDAPNPRSFWRLKFLEHAQAVIGAVTQLAPTGSEILDIGCAQGNLAIMLAERGYCVTAVDPRGGFVEYARKKDERGLVRWVTGDAFDVAGEPEYAAVILSEVIEHVIDPAALLRRALDLLAPDGALVFTTPNGHCLRNDLPSFAEASRSTNGFKGVTIGPAGEDHIYAFRPAEVEALVDRAGGVLVSRAFVNSILLNSHVQPLLDRPLLGAVYLGICNGSAAVPVARRLLGETLLAIARKRSGVVPSSPPPRLE